MLQGQTEQAGRSQPCFQTRLAGLKGQRRGANGTKSLSGCISPAQSHCRRRGGVCLTPVPAGHKGTTGREAPQLPGLCRVRNQGAAAQLCATPLLPIAPSAPQCILCSPLLLSAPSAPSLAGCGCSLPQESPGIPTLVLGRALSPSQIPRTPGRFGSILGSNLKDPPFPTPPCHLSSDTGHLTARPLPISKP